MSDKRARRGRAELYSEQGGRCCYCDGATWLRGAEPREKAMARLGLVGGTKHSKKMMRYAEATFEHLKRRADGGTSARHNGMMACSFCNTMRCENEIRTHRTDMQALVVAGLHPVNRPLRPVDNYRDVRKLALRAIKSLRAGKSITTGETS